MRRGLYVVVIITFGIVGGCATTSEVQAGPGGAATVSPPPETPPDPASDLPTVEASLRRVSERLRQAETKLDVLRERAILIEQEKSKLDP